MAFAEDYITVAERIEAFYAKHPDGSLQSEITHLTDTLVIVKAWAYRTADDQRPGIGHSSLGIPGTTSFTRGSEIENAESSAWGRALAALGFETKKGIASRDEVTNKAPYRCAIHNVAMVRSKATGTWGHMVDGAPCLGRAA